METNYGANSYFDEDYKRMAELAKINKSIKDLEDQLKPLLAQADHVRNL